MPIRIANVQKTKRKLSFYNILLPLLSILLLLTLLSGWLVAGMYAKYVVSGNTFDSARVAKTGVGKLELWESPAELKSGVFQLDKEAAPTKENKYDQVIPGVDIPKDPYVVIELKNAEVDYALYIRVVKSDPFPDEYVTFDLADDWEEVEGEDGVYRYKEIITSGTANWKIGILKNDVLNVSEHFFGKDFSEFKLTFNAWLVQMD